MYVTPGSFWRNPAIARHRASARTKRNLRRAWRFSAFTLVASALAFALTLAAPPAGAQNTLSMTEAGTVGTLDLT